MNAYSGHWFHSSPVNGRPIEAELSTSGDSRSGTGKGRRVERVAVDLGAALRQRGASGVSVQIMNLSTEGFRVATHLDLAPGTDVWLRMGGLEPCHARVVWSEGHFVGCEFVRALHPAVLEMVVGKAEDQ